MVAIFSLNHRPIGKSTQARPNTAGAHLMYITRPRAASRVEGRGIPTTPTEARDYFNAAEAADRKNARMADKLMLALPKELDAEQRADLVREYAEDITRGRAPWLAAFHDRGKDAHNPHCHLVIRDRDPGTGRRVARLSDKGSTHWLRSLWEGYANRALERAGYGERIDRRSLADQGTDRAPTIHEGPRGRAMEARGAAPTSRSRNVRNGQGARSRTREVDYPAIDQGRSRSAHNRRRRETPAEVWAGIDGERQARELEELAPYRAPGLPEHDETEHAGGGRRGIDPQAIARDAMPSDYERAKRQADLLEADYRNQLDKAFLDPVLAERRMERYRAKHGPDALYEKLARDSGLYGGRRRFTKFGRPPGSWISTERFQPGGKLLLQDSHEARRALPQAMKDYHDSQRFLMAMERAFPEEAWRAREQEAMRRITYGPPPHWSADRQLEQPVAPPKPREPVLRPGADPELWAGTPEERQAKQAQQMEQRRLLSPPPALPEQASRRSQQPAQEQQHKVPEQEGVIPPLSRAQQAQQRRMLGVPAPPERGEGPPGPVQPPAPHGLQPNHHDRGLSPTGPELAPQSRKEEPERHSDQARPPSVSQQGRGPEAQSVPSPDDRVAEPIRQPERAEPPPDQISRPPAPERQPEQHGPTSIPASSRMAPSVDQRPTAGPPPTAPSPEPVPPERKAEPEKAARPPSFREQMEADRKALAADPERQERENQRTLARMKEERERGFER